MTTGGQSVNIGSTNNLTIGKAMISVDGRYWNGTIDDVRLYNYSLSPKEVREIYNGRFKSSKTMVATGTNIDISNADYFIIESNGTTLTQLDLDFLSVINQFLKKRK